MTHSESSCILVYQLISLAYEVYSSVLKQSGFLLQFMHITWVLQLCNKRLYTSQKWSKSDRNRASDFSPNCGLKSSDFYFKEIQIQIRLNSTKIRPIFDIKLKPNYSLFISDFYYIIHY